MSEFLHGPNPNNDLLKFTKLETVPDEEVEAYRRGVHLISEGILPHMTHAPLVFDYDRELGGDDPVLATAVLYSEEKDVSAEVRVRVYIDGEDEEEIADALGAMPGHDVVSLEDGLYALDDVELLWITAEFYKGRRPPESRCEYGTVLYFQRNYDSDEKSTDQQIGHLELQLQPGGVPDLAAHFGDAGNTQDGHVNFGAVETMATWLRNVKELRPEQ